MAPRVWFITGASSGFGLLMAEKALANGEKVVATLRKPEVIASLAAQYTKEQLIVLKLDVTKEEDIKAGFAAAKEAFGRIDICFNNAGYGIIGEVEGTSDEKARNQFEVNFWGAVNVTKEAVKFFREVNKPVGGTLMNMSSMFGIDAPPGAGFYAATKFAVEAVTDSLVKELDPAWNIKVMVLCPGWFKTNMTVVNAVVEDVHPAYAGNENLGSIQVRKLAVGLIKGDSPVLQDAGKLIEKFWALSNLEKPPYRIAFGEDAKGCFQAKWTALKADLEASQEWSQDLTYST
ncbi:NAD(P)-binding protein [Roridomyces roridus]|uniref:NAD(P)-binding protein n=1 Tax=Roridomyces roridus TaxID=1738132 RepID=A0AAD7FJS9_9AGAR|nr:NAD(P)-binding protein [Roridomyces roridus]